VSLTARTCDHRTAEFVFLSFALKDLSNQIVLVMQYWKEWKTFDLRSYRLLRRFDRRRSQMLPDKRPNSHDSVDHGRPSPVRVVRSAITTSRLYRWERVMVPLVSRRKTQRQREPWSLCHPYWRRDMRWASFLWDIVCKIQVQENVSRKNLNRLRRMASTRSRNKMRKEPTCTALPLFV
jgi:hypothetical protein